MSNLPPVYFMLFDTWCVNKNTSQLRFFKAGTYLGDEWVPIFEERGLAMMELPCMSKENKMELKVKKDRVLEAAKECPNAKGILKKLFPEAFKDEWIDVTPEVQIEIERVGANGRLAYQAFYVRLKHRGLAIAKLTPMGMEFYDVDRRYKVDGKPEGAMKIFMQEK